MSSNQIDTQPLARIRVVDLTTGISGGYASKLLADAGADILKIEMPEGDPLRRRAFSKGSLDEAGDGLLFRYLHTSKRCCVLDLETDAGRAVLRGLYAGCDLVLESAAEGWLDEREVGEAALSRANPSASWLSVSAFGRAGPWSDRPANDFTLQAWCGSISARGRTGLPPIQAGGEVGDWLSGACLGVAALAALRKASNEAARRAIPPAAVAKAVTHALTAERPKTRYLVGRDAQIRAALAKVLPDRMQDWLVARFMGLPK